MIFYDGIPLLYTWHVPFLDEKRGRKGAPGVGITCLHT
jgi:hypothetical protein